MNIRADEFRRKEPVPAAEKKPEVKKK